MNWNYISGFFDADGSITHWNNEWSPALKIHHWLLMIIMELICSEKNLNR